MSSEKSEKRAFSPDAYTRLIADYHLPRYNELPAIELYMDQLITYVTDATALLDTSMDKPLTPAMVNNYVKQGVVPRPLNKRYNRSHVAYLMGICILKRAYSLADIKRLVDLQTCSDPLDRTYDFFCDTFEEGLNVLFKLFTGKIDAGSAVASAVADIGVADPKRIALAAAACTAAKVFVDVELDWVEQQAVSGAEK